MRVVPLPCLRPSTVGRDAWLGVMPCLPHTLMSHAIPISVTIWVWGMRPPCGYAIRAPLLARMRG